MKTIKFNIIKNLILGLFFVLASTPSFAIDIANDSKDSEIEEEFNVTDMIMHHVKDAHEFHVMDWKGHAISIPLPIILWTENGLVTFMSSEFQHDDLGNVVVEKNGQNFVKFHEEIYYANDIQWTSLLQSWCFRCFSLSFYWYLYLACPQDHTIKMESLKALQNLRNL